MNKENINNRVINSLDGIDNDWRSIIMPLIPNIVNKLYESDVDMDNVSPSVEKWFTWAKLTPFCSVRVVIIGQDPYPNPKHAHGLSFSSLDKKIPGSLRNVFKCLYNELLMDKEVRSADLSDWAKQGILLYNTSLSTVVGKSGVHYEIWREFTVDILKALNTLDHTVVYMLWGNVARGYKEYVTNEKHVVYEWSHPSNMCQGRLPIQQRFIHCDHFTKLKEHDIHIKWES